MVMRRRETNRQQVARSSRCLFRSGSPSGSKRAGPKMWMLYALPPYRGELGASVLLSVARATASSTVAEASAAKRRATTCNMPLVGCFQPGLKAEQDWPNGQSVTVPSRTTETAPSVSGILATWR